MHILKTFLAEFLKNDYFWKIVTCIKAEDRTWLRINMLNQNPDVNILEDEYHGFLTFTRKKCGADFLKAFLDGRITWELHVNEIFNILHIFIKIFILYLRTLTTCMSLNMLIFEMNKLALLWPCNFIDVREISNSKIPKKINFI